MERLSKIEILILKRGYSKWEEIFCYFEFKKCIIQNVFAVQWKL